jgi:hypothetical protein
MGFSEDDRIRHKNRVQNLVHDQYTSLKDKGCTDSDVLSYFDINYRDTPFRNEIFSTINKIVGRSNDEVPTNS